MTIDLSCGGGKLPHGRTIKEKLLDYVRPSRFGDYTKTTLSKTEITHFETVQEGKAIVDEIQEVCAALWHSTDCYLETSCKLYADFTSGFHLNSRINVNERGQAQKVEFATIKERCDPDAAQSNTASDTPQNYVSLIELLGQVRALLVSLKLLLEKNMESALTRTYFYHDELLSERGSDFGDFDSAEKVARDFQSSGGYLNDVSLLVNLYLEETTNEVKITALHQYKEELDLCRYRMSLCHPDSKSEKQSCSSVKKDPKFQNQTTREKIVKLRALKLKASTVAFQSIYDDLALDLASMVEEFRKFPTLLQQTATLSETALAEAHSKLNFSLAKSKNSSVSINESPGQIVAGEKATVPTSGYSKTKSGVTIYPIKINWRGTMKSPALSSASASSDITMNEVISV